MTPAGSAVHHNVLVIIPADKEPQRAVGAAIDLAAERRGTLVALVVLDPDVPARLASTLNEVGFMGEEVGMQVGDTIEKRGGRIVVLIGVGLMGLGVLSLTVIQQPWHLYLAFTLMIPGWVAMGGGSINTIIAKWFDHRRGLAASLALNGASFGGLVFAPAFAWAIDTFGFAKACYAAVAVVLTTLWPLAAFALRPRRADEHDLGDEGAAQFELTGVPMSRRTLLATPRYLTMVGAFSIGLLAQISFIAHQAAFLEPTLGLKGAGWGLSVTALSAVVGRLAVGAVIDRIDRRLATAANLLVQIVSMIVLLSASSAAGLYLGCILFGLGVGNLITLPGLIAQQEFPRRDFARAVSLNVAVTQLVAAVGPYLLGLLHDLSGNYRSSLIACLALQAAAALLILVRPSPRTIDA